VKLGFIARVDVKEGGGGGVLVLLPVVLALLLLDLLFGEAAAIRPV